MQNTNILLRLVSSILLLALPFAAAAQVHISDTQYVIEGLTTDTVYLKTASNT
ncbi:MAG: hypothetical protein ACI94D_002119, partial [Neolewinella sp.]